MAELTDTLVRQADGLLAIANGSSVVETGITGSSYMGFL